eukprot:TRINITY_DN10540_c0_g1_i1.p1 TRINITY_DN10540_c0_g1~~TRINITY_DN10540_c0_g1_i1.p1  ORF type:complete len:485 (+),score=162.82 TRINITY_DN10540_c0_g1_i1:75-1457(+)
MAGGAAGAPAASVLRDRVRGLLLGAAVGDAVGLGTEFMSRAEAHAAYGALLARRAAGGEDPPRLAYSDFVRDDHRSKWRAGEFTDDTAACVLVARLLLAAPEPQLADPDPCLFAAALREWHRKGFPELGETSGRGMGLTVARVVDDPAFLSAPAQCAKRVWDDGGRTAAANGAVMRAAPAGLLAVAGRQGPERAAAAAAAIAQTTHYDPRSTAVCVAVAGAAGALLLGPDGVPDLAAVREEALRRGVAELKGDAALGAPPPPRWPCPQCTFESAAEAAECEMCGGGRPAQGAALRHNAGFGVAWSGEEHAAARYDAARAAEELRQALWCSSLDALELDDPKRMGYCMKALGCGFWALGEYCGAVREGAAPERAVARALMAITMAAGDADTNGVVAGALLGCAAGAAALPGEWVGGLLHREWLTALADRLADRAAALQHPDGALPPQQPAAGKQPAAAAPL